MWQDVRRRVLTGGGVLQFSQLCLTSKMSHGYGWRGSCAAGDVTDMAVGSGALLGRLVRFRKNAHFEVPIATWRLLEAGR